MPARTERFEMRLDQETLDTVDEWRSDQRDLPSRAEAIRRLIGIALTPRSGRDTKISDGEKLILSMLSDLYKHEKVKTGIDPSFVMEAIYGGHYWGLGWQYQGLLHDHVDSQHTVTEVVNVLDMWSFIERGYQRLSEEDKIRVEKEAPPFGKNPRFAGFDGNNETEHMGIAGFLIDKLDRFATFDGRDLNSHHPSIETYRRMLRVFEPVRRTLTGGDLGVAQIIAILNEKAHPEHRGKVSE